MVISMNLLPPEFVGGAKKNSSSNELLSNEVFILSSQVR
jgi:hypothetical protein